MSADGTTGRLVLVLAVALVTYATRLAGFRLRLGRGENGNNVLPPAAARFLGYVPIAAFAALVALGLSGGSGSLTARLAGVGVAAVAALRLRRLWLSIAAGLVGYWLVEGLTRLV